MTIEPTKHYQVPGGQGGMNFTPRGYYFIELMIDEVLYEGSRSIRSVLKYVVGLLCFVGDRVLLLVRNPNYDASVGFNG